MNNKEIEYKAYTLGDIKVIELLLMFRYKYDENMMIERTSLMEVGSGELNEEMIVTYADLDVCIEGCKFNEEQLAMIRLISYGYDYEEIAEILNVNQSSIARRMKTIYRAIAKENEWRWRKSIYQHRLGLKNKTCSRCSLQMPATVEFFSNDNRNNDGFHSFCKRCRS